MATALAVALETAATTSAIEAAVAVALGAAAAAMEESGPRGVKSNSTLPSVNMSPSSVSCPITSTATPERTCSQPKICHMPINHRIYI